MILVDVTKLFSDVYKACLRGIWGGRQKFPCFTGGVAVISLSAV